jgi:hypothetical protein
LQEASAVVLADEAETVLAFSDVAMPRAEKAVETTISGGLVPASFVDVRL